MRLIPSIMGFSVALFSLALASCQSSNHQPAPSVQMVNGGVRAPGNGMCGATNMELTSDGNIRCHTPPMTNK